MTTAPTVAALIAALNDRSPAVRKRAAETLGELEEMQAVEPLTHALKDSDTDVRVTCCSCAGDDRRYERDGTPHLRVER